MLHWGIRPEERGSAVDREAKQAWRVRRSENSEVLGDVANSTSLVFAAWTKRRKSSTRETMLLHKPPTATCHDSAAARSHQLLSIVRPKTRPIESSRLRSRVTQSVIRHLYRPLRCSLRSARCVMKLAGAARNGC